MSREDNKYGKYGRSSSVTPWENDQEERYSRSSRKQGSRYDRQESNEGVEDQSFYPRLRALANALSQWSEEQPTSSPTPGDDDDETEEVYPGRSAESRSHGGWGHHGGGNYHDGYHGGYHNDYYGHHGGGGDYYGHHGGGGDWYGWYHPSHWWGWNSGERRNKVTEDDEGQTAQWGQTSGTENESDESQLEEDESNGGEKSYDAESYDEDESESNDSGSYNDSYNESYDHDFWHHRW